MLNIFRSLARSKRAMVFVDYEYWFYSYKNKYNLRPDTAAWRAELEKQFDIEDIMIFADFSSPASVRSLQSCATSPTPLSKPARQRSIAKKI